MAGKGSVTPRVVEYLTEHPNQIVHRSKMAKALGLRENQVSQAMYNLRKSSPRVWAHVEVIHTANSWRYTPEEVQTTQSSRGEQFIKVGVRTDGSVLLEDADGNLYVAKPLRAQ